jgi:hypothetical protein
VKRPGLPPHRVVINPTCKKQLRPVQSRGANSADHAGMDATACGSPIYLCGLTAVSAELMRAAPSCDADESLRAATEASIASRREATYWVGTDRLLHLRVVQHRLALGPEASDDGRLRCAGPKSADEVPQVRRRSPQLEI